MKNRKNLWILIIVIIMALTSGFVAYKGAIAPKLYDKYLNEGIKYLQDGDYEEAILAFDKAIKIDDKSTEARVYQAKSYIGNEENDKAVEVLGEAQNIDKTNEELLKEILEILKEIDTDVAYEFLDKFVGAVGKDNLSQDIKDILDSANEVPNEPIADPSPGTYINPISVKLKLDKISIGHNYYYTVDGSIPDRSSNKYSGKIEISETTTIKLIGYNKNYESTDIVTLKYIIDKEILNDTKNDIEEAEKLIEETTVGSKVGNISQSDKKKLQQIVNKANDLLGKESVEYQAVYNTKSSIEDGIKEFKNNIIKPTDKSKLKSTINEAQKLYDNSTEGSKNGQYKSGSKATLLKAIKSAQSVNKDDAAKQNKIDSEVIALKNSIEKFKRNIIKSSGNIEKKIKNRGWINSNDNSIVFYIKEKEIAFALDFHEGYRHSILDKIIENDRIIYKVSDDGNVGYIYISSNGNLININVNTKYGNWMSGNYYSNKNKIIEIAHRCQFIETDVENKNLCIDRYDYFGFKYMGISKQDVRNYYKNN